jgi:hypothetical protein
MVRLAKRVSWQSNQGDRYRRWPLKEVIERIRKVIPRRDIVGCVWNALSGQPWQGVS